MDIKGGSWVGDMCQRLEAMCVEVEEVICEDTLKYVENQVRTVGDTVKKFYSDIMQDLQSPSSLDPIKEDLCLNVVHHDKVKACKKSEVDDETEPVDTASEPLVKDFDGAAACGDSINCSSGIYSVIKPCEPNISNSGGEKYIKGYSKSYAIGMALSNQVTSVAKDMVCRNDFVCNLPSITVVAVDKSGEVTSTAPDNEADESSSVPMDAILKSAFEASHNENGVGVPRDMIEGYEDCDGVIDNKTRMLFDEHLSTDFDTSLSKADLSTSISCSGKNLKEVDEKHSLGDIETSIPSLSWEVGRCDADRLGVPVGEQFNNVKLEESCVLVQKNEKHYKSGRENVQKSYKKRIQDVFSPRRWSKGKRDHEQFSVWYEEQIARDLMSTSMSQTEILKPQLSESCESDWELL